VNVRLIFAVAVTGIIGGGFRAPLAGQQSSGTPTAALAANSQQSGTDCIYVRDLRTPSGEHWRIDADERLHANESTAPNVWHLLTQRSGQVYAMYGDGRWFALSLTSSTALHTVQSPGGCPALPTSPDGHQITGNRGFVVDQIGNVWTVVDPPLANIPGPVLLNGQRYSGSDRGIAQPPDHPFALAFCQGLIVVQKDGLYYGIDPISLQTTAADRARCSSRAPRPPSDVKVVDSF
jgi:hypothetical protein